MACRLLPLLVGACLTLMASRVDAAGDDWSEFDRESERLDSAREQRTEQKAYDAVVHFTDRPTSLEVGGGQSSLVGLLGAQATYSPFEWLALSVGCGVDFGGFQLTGSLRGRVLVWNRPSLAQALVLIPAFRAGRFLDDPSMFQLGEQSEDQSERVVEHGKWLQTWLGYELRLRGGFSALAGGGFAYLFNAGACKEGPVACDPLPASFEPSYGAFAGYSF